MVIENIITEVNMIDDASDLSILHASLRFFVVKVIVFGVERKLQLYFYLSIRIAMPLV